MGNDTTTISQFRAAVPCPILTVSARHCLHMSSKLVHAVSRWFAAAMTKGYFSLTQKHKPVSYLLLYTRISISGLITFALCKS